jgi:hypothetical protein
MHDDGQGGPEPAPITQSLEPYFPAILKRLSNTPYLTGGVNTEMGAVWFWTGNLDQAMRMTVAEATKRGPLVADKVKLKDYHQERARHANRN